MNKKRFEEVKRIHGEIEEASERYYETGACADSDEVSDKLHDLFIEKHTDWLIKQAEKIEHMNVVIGDNKLSKDELLDELVATILSTK